VTTRKNDKLQQFPVCGHVFHKDSVDAWLRNPFNLPNLSKLCPYSVAKWFQWNLKPGWFHLYLDVAGSSWFYIPQEAQAHKIVAWKKLATCMSKGM
jgi:hypothetical protein